MTPEQRGPFRLDGRVALVTGAASGIGAATARVFAEAGADVAAAWFPGDPHDVGATAEAVEAAGRRCHVVEVDVSDAASVERMVESTVTNLGRLDVVVANAAIARDVPFTELDDARFDSLLQVDLYGVVRTFRAAIPHLQERGWGRLLTTSSIAGAFQGWARHAHYTNSRRAQEILKDFAAYLPKFKKVMPVEYRRALAELAKARETNREAELEAVKQ